MKVQSSRGVTLIELLIVVIIIGIIAGVAYPSYRQAVIRSNRTEAKAALESVSQQLEKCFTRVNSYAECFEEDLVALPAETDRYTFALEGAATATTYVIQAIPRGGQAADTTCGTLKINQRGQRTQTGPGTDCW
jgi:type IV pilus assembly protein PilE